MSNNNEDETRTSNKFLPWIVLGGVLLAVAVIVALVVFFTTQNVISEGNKKEATLSTLYADGAVKLSTCLVNTSQAANVAQAESEALQEVFAAAISARDYSTAAGGVDEGALFSAIVEAYPNVDGLQDTFQQVISVIVGCRADYAKAQTRVQVAVAEFNNWRTGSWTVRTFGGEDFPNENLYVSIGDTQATGQEALDIINTPIVDNSTITAYEDGVIEIEDPFDTDDN